MALYVIADLHLSTNEETNKPMEVFGNRWSDYTEKIRRNWNALITPEDTVVIPGDVSWALTPEESVPDLKFVDSLPGRKIVGKGNHDFWWATAKKLRELFEANGITTVSILFNNAYRVGNLIVAGTRGWFNDGSLKMPPNTDYDKLVNRENERLKISLSEAVRLRGDTNDEIVAFLHFPPARGSFVCRPICDTLKEFGVKRCYYGHIHGDYNCPKSHVFEDVTYTLIAADYLNFIPTPIFKENPEISS